MYSASCMMTRMLCSITRSVMPNSRFAWRNRSSNPLISVGLIPAVGSSRSSIFGSLISAMANSSSFCWPKDRSPPGKRRLACSPTNWRRSSALRSSAGELGGRHADQHVLHARHPPVDAGLLERAEQAQARDLRHAQPGDLASLESDRSPVDRVLADDGVEQRGLARSVGADQAVDLPRRDREAHVLVRDHAAERLADVLDFEDRGHQPPSEAASSTPWPNRSGHFSRAQPRMPRGKKTTMTTMSRPSATLCQPSRYFQNSSCVTWKIAAPRTGPQSVPFPPRMAMSTIHTP